MRCTYLMNYNNTEGIYIFFFEKYMFIYRGMLENEDRREIIIVIIIVMYDL